MEAAQTLAIDAFAHWKKVERKRKKGKKGQIDGYGKLWDKSENKRWTRYWLKEELSWLLLNEIGLRNQFFSSIFPFLAGLPSGRVDNDDIFLMVLC